MSSADKYYTGYLQKVSTGISQLLSARDQKISWYSQIDSNGETLKGRFINSKDLLIDSIRNHTRDFASALTAITDDQETLIYVIDTDAKKFFPLKEIQKAATLGIESNVDSVIIINSKNLKMSKTNARLLGNAEQRPLLEYFTFDEMLYNPITSIYTGKPEIAINFEESHPELRLDDLLPVRLNDMIPRYLGAVRNDIIKYHNRELIPESTNTESLIFRRVV